MESCPGGTTDNMQATNKNQRIRWWLRRQAQTVIAHLRVRPAMLVPVLAASLLADGNEALPDFSSLSLQELSSIKVTSVSKKQQKLSQVAAAVYVISQEEIHRSGLTSVPELLRIVPGLEVARIDSNKWAVTSRGFNGRFANKLLVLIDGRSIYSPIFSGVYWDTNMPMLDNIERIEVIRGPGAAVWGANAVAGVINIITKSAEETTGVEFNASGGTVEHGSVSGQYGGKINDGLYYRGYVNSADHGPLETEDGSKARDGWSDGQAGFRMDGTTKSGGWQLEGDLFHSVRNEASNLPTPENFFSSVTEYGKEPDTAADLTFEWHRRLNETSELTFKASYDYVNRPELGFSQAKDSTGDFEIQYHFKATKYHDISVGLGDRVITDDVDPTSFVLSHLSYQTGSGFAQDEIHLLNDRLLLTGGIKIEHDILSGWQVQPTARALWAPNAKHSAWLSASRAVRTPTFYERTAELEVAAIPGSPQTFGLPLVTSIDGSNTYQSEVLKDYEIGYRAQISPKFSIDVTGFYDQYDDLRTGTPGQMSIVPGPQPYILVPLIFTNYGKGHAEGAEAALTYHPVSHWKISSSYTYLNLHQSLLSVAPPNTQTASDNASPAHQWKLQSYLNLTKAIQFDCLLFYSSSFFSPVYLAADQSIPQHTRADIRLGWRVSPRFEISLVGQDLFSAHHLEITPEALSPITDAVRSFYVRTNWRF